MSTVAAIDWQAANRQYLLAALAEVREALARHVEELQRDAPEQERVERLGQQTLPEMADAMPAPPAIETLCEIFGLSSFERAVLLLAAGMELDSTFASLCGLAQGDAQRAYPTFSLALAAFPESHWSALSPAGPLRYWRFIEADKAETLTSSPLRLDERVLHYLAGVHHLDERLKGLIEPLPATDDLAPSQHRLSERLVAMGSRATDGAALPAMQLCGPDLAAKQAIAAAACAEMSLDLSRMSAHVIPANAAELDALMRLWGREAALNNSALFLDCHESDPAHEHVIDRLIEGLDGLLIIASRERRTALRRPLLTIDVHNPTTDEQRTLWQNALDSTAAVVNGTVETLVAQFDLNVPAIRAACARALGDLATNEHTPLPDKLDAALWASCRVEARPRMSNLVQRLRPVARWDDLVLPAAQKQILPEIAVHVRQRYRVYETWGFAAASARGLGVSALFTGASGTGKTMAAEVLANELQLDLYRIDLSQVVSKYIGETEKNLGRVFDAAEAGGAILLFDEADALFGKRTEIKDSHDRYANIEISYLLQRMEDYRGLAILTTNLKDALDTAFLRRIRFIVRFPFPDVTERAEIWRRIFPPDTPTEGLDVNKLAQLNVAGGNIRNIALLAAFSAADAGERVRMAHLLRATRVEYSKLEKSLAGAETSGWV